jgi:hypothetical protein
MDFRREGTYAIVAILVTLVVAATLFVYPAWSQDWERKTERQTEKKVEKKNEKRNQKNTGTERNSTRTVDSLSRVAAQDPSFQQALQGSAENDGSGDLVGNDVEVEPDDPKDPIERIEVFGDECYVTEEDAFIVFEVVDEQSDDDKFGIVVDDDNVQIIERSDRIIIEDNDENGNEDIQFFTFEGNAVELSGNLEVRSSFGIECDDDNGNNNNRRDRDRDDRFRERVNQVLEEEGLIDEDGDGDIDQDDEFLDAQNDLDDDGEVTDADDFDDDGDLDDGPVSATAEDGQAEASTPGAVARSGGDPDELEPLRSAPDDVVNEIPTSGPLPNTGGMPMVYWLLPLAGLLMLAGLPVYRWAKRRA